MEAAEKVSISHKQFSQIVAEADATPEDKTAYQFSNGRKFEAGDGATAEPEA